MSPTPPDKQAKSFVHLVVDFETRPLTCIVHLMHPLFENLTCVLAFTGDYILYYVTTNNMTLTLYPDGKYGFYF